MDRCGCLLHLVFWSALSLRRRRSRRRRARDRGTPLKLDQGACGSRTGRAMAQDSIRMAQVFVTPRDREVADRGTVGLQTDGAVRLCYPSCRLDEGLGLATRLGTSAAEACNAVRWLSAKAVMSSSASSGNACRANRHHDRRRALRATGLPAPAARPRGQSTLDQLCPANRPHGWIVSRSLADDPPGSELYRPEKRQ